MAALDGPTSLPFNDTGSDTDDSQETPPKFDLTSVSHVQCGQYVFERVMYAIDLLETCDPTVMDENHHINHDILTNARILIEFFDRLPCLLRDVAYRNQIMTISKHIVHVTFVTRLFELRKVFSQKKHFTVDICWTEVILANLSLLSVALASGACPDELTIQTTNSLMRQRQHNYILAAAQLPDSWSSIFQMLNAHYASPAARRLALRLLYSVYVFGRRLIDYNPWTSMDTEANGLADICLQLLARLSFSGNGNTDVHESIQDPIHCSILISLYASASQSTSSRGHLDMIRPLSLACLQEILQAIITYDLETPVSHVVVPPEQLNPSLSMLMRWSDLFPWCWLLWDDHRIAGFECIIYLSVTWLYNVGSHRDDMHLTETDSMKHLSSFVQAHPTSTRLPVSFLSALGKSCWAICRITECNANIGRYIPSISNSMLEVFIYLRERTGLEACVVKEMALESLVHVDDPIFRSQLKDVLVKMPCMIQGMADDAIAGLKRMLTKTDRNFSEYLEGQVAVVRTVLRFLVICWYKGCENCVLRGSALTLLGLTADLVTTASNGPLLELCCDLWTALAIISENPNIRISTERHIVLWDWVVSKNDFNLMVAVSFASYLTVAIPDVDPLRHAEAWNYLSSIFLMILQGCFPEEDEFIIMASPAICCALTKLLVLRGMAFQYIARSPWAKSLADQLRTVLRGGCEHSNSYIRSLCRNLGEIGPQLLDLLECQSQQTTTASGNVSFTQQIDRRLLPLPWHGSSCLLLMPRTLMLL
ncbi:hypothetical protein APHAL10511_006271 [Amanita phalloides]|nr:hypothetical protein APHAL10511_006271 [Amanita phalloides]